MREDYMEAMERMFPDGYAIVYTSPDGIARLNIFNPHGYDLLGEVYDRLTDMADEQVP